MKYLNNKRLILLLLGLILFFALMGLSLVKREQPTWPEMFVKDSVSWVQGILFKPIRWGSGLFADLRSLVIVYEENRALKATLALYARDASRLNYLESENERLKVALAFTERQSQADHYIYRIAEVVAISPDGYNNTVVINLGERNGIREDMAVMTVDGLIGRVQRVMPFTSNVQLLTDISETVQSSKAVAVTIRGKESESFGVIERYDHNERKLVMTKIEQDDPIQVGDQVVTSGLGQVFPKGITVGTVDSVSIGEFGITYTAHIEPAASFHRLREVFVVEVPEP